MRTNFLLTLLLLLLVLVLLLLQYVIPAIPFFKSSLIIAFWVFILCSCHPLLARSVHRKYLILRIILALLLAGIWIAIEGQLFELLLSQSTAEPHAMKNGFLSRRLSARSAQWLEFVGAAQSSVISFADRIASELWPSAGRLLPAILIALLILALWQALRRWFLELIPNAYFVFVAHGLSESGRRLGSYIRSETMQASLTALLWGGALWLLSIPNGFLLSVAMAMASLIPYWGIWFIGFAPPFLTAVFSGNAFQAAALAIALSAIWLLRRVLFAERMQLSRPRIAAIGSLALALLGAFLVGSSGLLLVLPLSSIVLIIVRAFLQARSTIVRKVDLDPLAHLSP